jgi:hypothetical protein
MPRLFALDHNFPDPIVAVLSDFHADADLVRIDQIDPRMPDLEDWELLLALHLDPAPWDGLITTDSSMLNQGPELAALIQTNLTLVVAVESGHNPVKASGLLFVPRRGLQADAPGHAAGLDVETPRATRTGSRGTSSSGMPSTTAAPSTTSGPSSS